MYSLEIIIWVLRRSISNGDWSSTLEREISLLLVCILWIHSVFTLFPYICAFTGIYGTRKVEYLQYATFQKSTPFQRGQIESKLFMVNGVSLWPEIISKWKKFLTTKNFNKKIEIFSKTIATSSQITTSSYYIFIFTAKNKFLDCALISLKKVEKKE
jgi:hypothetical protein